MPPKRRRDGVKSPTSSKKKLSSSSSNTQTVIIDAADAVGPVLVSSVAELAMVFILPSVVEFLVGPPKLAVSKDADFVTVGRLASLSKESALAVRCNQLWRPAYADATASVAESYDPPPRITNNMPDVVYSSWMGENFLLDIFKPDSILVGASHSPETVFFRGLGMLLSRTCQVCDAPGHGGSPFACLRLCSECVKTKEESFALCPSHINRFLLTKGDLKKAGVTPFTISNYENPDGGSQAFYTKELYNVNALKAVCLEKYGSVEDVVAAGAAKKKAAKKKYDDLKETAKPMKKLPAILSLTIYDGNLQKVNGNGINGDFLCGFYNALPLGYLDRDDTTSLYRSRRYGFTKSYQQRGGSFGEKSNYQIDDLQNLLLIKNALKLSRREGVQPFASLTPPHRDALFGLRATSLVEGCCEETLTHDNLWGEPMISNETTTISILTVENKSFYLVREYSDLIECYVCTTTLLVHRNDNKGVPLVLLKVGGGELEGDTLPVSPARFHPRMLSELRALGLAENASLQDLIVSLMKALTPSETLWEDWHDECRGTKARNFSPNSQTSLQVKVMAALG